MPTRYLAVGPAWSASGTTNQGSLDSVSGTGIGTGVDGTIPCPGVFPVIIGCQLNTKSSKTAYILDEATAGSTVYAEGDRVLVFEATASSAPSVGTRVRAVSKEFNRRLFGGFFDQVINTATPLLRPYGSCTFGAIMDSVGLTTAMAVVQSPTKQVVVGGNNADAADFANYLRHGSTLTSPDRLYTEYKLLAQSWNLGLSGHYFFDSGSATDTAQRMALNLSPKVAGTFSYCRPSAALVTVQGANLLSQPILTGVNFATNTLYANYDNSTITALVKPANRLTAFNAATSGVPQLNLNGTAAEGAASFNPKKLSLYVPSLAENIHYAGIDANNQVFLGELRASTSTPSNELTPSFFSLSSGEGISSGENTRNKAFTRPAFSFNSAYAPNFDGQATRPLYSGAFPTTASINKFTDVQSTDYGFVFLDGYSKQLHFMFDRHFYFRQKFNNDLEDPSYLPENKELINKLMRCPPRSVDFRPARNMDLGVPATPSGVNPDIGSTIAVLRAIVVSGGTGYTTGSPIAFAATAPDTVAVTGTIVVAGGVITSVTLNTITGTYTRRPQNGVITGAGSGAVIRLEMSNDSMYATASTTLTDDSLLHGGGGHAAVLGTYNGALIHGGKVSVWGSNRWGQMVIPDLVKDQVLVDVAVSVAPMVISSIERSENDVDVIYSESQADAYAKQQPTFGNYRYHYPRGGPLNDITAATNITGQMRYGGHINYGNLPGHIAVVTAAGRVYCWGNNLYGQCNVPTEISLATATTAPADPVAEVATGAFHTVARTRSGVLYVWGAGAPSVSANGYSVNTTVGSVFPALDNSANKAVSSSVHFGQSTLTGVLQNPQAVFTGGAATAYPAGNITNLPNNAGQRTAAGFLVSDPSGQRFKGMIAAGAFHTAVVDSQLKIQCFGAGRVTSGAIGMTPRKVAIAAGQQGIADQNPVWGRSYGSVRLPNGDGSASADPTMPDPLNVDAYDFTPKLAAFSSYPHYCQSLSQYLSPGGTTPGNSNLTYSGSLTNLGRFFQNLRFKKVVCGPFTTHGIVYDVVGNASSFAYSKAFKLSLHSRVVSWGKALTNSRPSNTGFITNNTAAFEGGMRVGPTGVINIIGGPVSGSNVHAGTTSTLYVLQDPVGSILGTGCRDNLEPVFTANPFPNPPFNENQTPAAYSLLNRIGVDTTEAAWNTNRNNPAFANWITGCPVTLSNFKVKDMAANGDFAAYVGYIATLQQSEALPAPNPSLLIDDSSASTFDFQSSVFFSGSVATRRVETVLQEAHPQRDNPYSGFKMIRRNRVSLPFDSFAYVENNAAKVKDRSLYYGNVRRLSSQIITPAGVNTTASLYYVAPCSIAISEANTVLVVNYDNRPVAWHYGEGAQTSIEGNALDLSLLPSVPVQSFKAARGHIVAVTDGDWPIAKSLASVSTTPRLVTELGSRLTITPVSEAGTVPDNLLYGPTTRSLQPVLLAWGAGDGREHGSNIFLGGYGRHGLGFLDTHAITRYDSTYNADTLGNPSANPLNLYETDTTVQWANYYGDYRWHVHTPPLIPSEGSYTVPGTYFGSPSGIRYANDIDPKLYFGYHEIEAMQSLLFFDSTRYALANDTNANRLLFSGTATASIPVSAFKPYFNYRQEDNAVPGTIPASNTICCTGPANGTVGAGPSKQNFFQEYYSPLSLTIQNQVDYVTDYSVGALHSAILFSSKVTSLSDVNAGNYKSSIANFRSMFNASDTTQFGNRRVCKLAIAGYGCEGQTAGVERRLGDGSTAPVVPQLFARNAKVFCGNSFTAVTNPIRIEQLASADTAITFTSGQLTIPITIPTTAQSPRIRGLDIVLELKATADLPPMDVSGWTIAASYKGNTWTLLGTPKSINTPSSISNLHLATTNPYSGTFTCSYRFSDRFNGLSGTNKAYSYTGVAGDSYTEAGLAPSDMSDGNTYKPAATYNTPGVVTLSPINTTTVNHYSLKGSYIPFTTATGATTSTPNYWNYGDPADPTLPISLDSGTINLVISGGTTNFSNRTVKVTLEIEVDDGDYPMVIYGNKRSGVWNEITPGFGPSYTADYTTAFNAIGYDGSAIDARETASCPCEQNTTDGRLARVSFPRDSSFICGTRKYGPSGNPEAVASQSVISESGSPNIDLATAVKRYPVANFTAVFSRILHRPFTTNFDLTSKPTLFAFPPTAFISGTREVILADVANPANSVCKLAANAAVLNVNKPLAAPIVVAKLNLPNANIYDLLSSSSTIACQASLSQPKLSLRLNLGTC
jgi:hypothetical protein